jgi:enterochelin esterase-like enzyme
MTRALFGYLLLTAAAPPPRRPPPVISPQVAPDGQVTFRLRADAAHAVTVAGQISKQPAALARGADGLWSVTLGPLPPGLYEYNFTVDGFRTVDPANPRVKPARAVNTSILEVPGRPPQPTELQDVPHGTVHVHRYFSRPLDGRARRLHVYTPPDYETHPATKYPTLYLLHGSGDDDACWSELGRAPFILDALIARKEARPMVVVMPDGHALPPPAPSADNVSAFSRDLLEEVVPLVERTYRVKKDGRSRAIAGLSMGGAQSLAVGLGHPEAFNWVGAFSAAMPEEPVLASALADAGLGKKLRWLWIGCGKEDGLLEGNRKLDATLTDKGVKHTLRVTDGGHAWPVWRAYLLEVAPQLFRP